VFLLRQFHERRRRPEQEMTIGGCARRAEVVYHLRVISIRAGILN
jgi:hypothetical protein